jgi:hypothetical protein
MKVNCVLCRSNKDEDVMLLCDNCNKGHHIYCLKPKLKVLLLYINLIILYLLLLILHRTSNKYY